MNDKNNKNKNNAFGKKLKALRKAKGLTQQVLAEKAGIDDKHLCRIEGGKYFPTYATLNNLLNALGVSIEDVGLTFDKLKINENPIMTKALQILNSAKDEKELSCYYEALKSTQKLLKLK